MCDFINKSAVKQLVHDRDRQCAPEFLSALDAAVRSIVEKACTAHNGGAKRLDAVILAAGASTGQPTARTSNRAIRDEVAFLELKINTITREEYIQAIRRLRAACG